MKETPGIKDRQGRELEMVFVEGDENIKTPRSATSSDRAFSIAASQTPPLVVANVGASK